MKYIVSGTVKSKKFSKEIEAKSEKHARQLTIVKFGSSQRVKATSIKITEIKKAK